MTNKDAQPERTFPSFCTLHPKEREYQKEKETIHFSKIQTVPTTWASTSWRPVPIENVILNHGGWIESLFWFVLQNTHKQTHTHYEVYLHSLIHTQHTKGRTAQRSLG